MKFRKLVENIMNNPIGYHGTNIDFEYFDSSKTKINTFGKGIYFVNNEEYAKEFGKIIIKASLNINNPFIIKDNYVANDDILHSVGIAKFAHLDSQDSQDKIKNAGYDGIVVLNAEGRKDLKYFIVFDTDQIKILNKKVI